MQSVNPPENFEISGTDPLQTRSVFWGVVGVVMLITILAVGIRTLRQVDESDHWVDHTRVVISTNGKLWSDIKDAESAERGYIITGDDAYFEPYRVAADDIPHTLAALTELTADSLSQQQRIKNLQSALAQRMLVLNEAVQQRKTSGFAAAEAVVVGGRGQQAMQKIRDASQEIEEEEDHLLDLRVQTRQSRVRKGFVATLFAAILGVIAFILAPLDVRRAVAERNAALQKRIESESRARAVFESAAQGILMVDQGGKIISANPAAGKLLGYDEGELIGKPVDVLVPQDVRNDHADHRRQYFVNPQTRPMGSGLDLRAQRKDGRLFDAEISLSYIRSPQETLAVAFVTDISKRKTDEQAIRQQREDLRRLAGRLMTAQDEERRRIARDLHDDLSQKLAYLAMDIGKLTGKAGTSELAQDLRPLQRRAVDAADTVRHISHELHPSILDDIGLEAALEQYCEEFQERAGIATHFTSQNVPGSLPREIAASVYQICQESLRNVSKHSQAEEVFVTLEFGDDMLRLSVRDEGVGLPQDRSKTGSSIGIISMKERAHLVNGEVSIQSQAGEGTEVTVSVPITGS